MPFRLNATHGYLKSKTTPHFLGNTGFAMQLGPVNCTIIMHQVSYNDVSLDELVSMDYFVSGHLIYVPCAVKSDISFNVEN